MKEYFKSILFALFLFFYNYSFSLANNYFVNTIGNSKTEILMVASQVDNNIFFGPQKYTRTSGAPNQFSNTFSLPSGFSAPFTLHVLNGEQNGINRISSAEIKLNGVNIFTQSDFNQQVWEITKTINLKSTNTIEVSLASKPGSYITITISGTVTNNQLPQIPIQLAPVNNLTNTSNQITFKWNSSLNAASYQLQVADNLQFTNPVINQVGLTATSFNANNLSKGIKYYWRVKAVNQTSSSDWSEIWNFTTAALPILTVIQPVENLLTKTNTTIVSGTVNDNSISITINGISCTVSSDKSFSSQTNLAEGTNVIRIVAKNSVGDSVLVLRHVKRDSTPPNLTVSSPSNNFITNQSNVLIIGTITDSTTVTLKINGNSVAVSNGTFSYNLLLQNGTNIITIVATDAAGNPSTVTRTVIKDSEAPIVHLTSPENNLATNLSSVNVSGSVEDSTAVTVTINGTSVVLNNKSFSFQVPLIDGNNAITVVATDAAGNTTTISRNVIADVSSPVLIVSEPVNNFVTKLLSVNVIGSTSDSTSVTLKINGGTVPLSAGAFNYPVSLNDGLNTITIVATDAAGNSTTITRNVRRDILAPTLTITSPADNIATNLSSINVSGSIADSSSVTVTVNGNPVTLNNNLFSYHLLLADGINTINVVAVDAAGNSTSVTRSVRKDILAPTITLSEPINNLVTKLSSVNVIGSVADSSSVSLSINGNNVTLSSGSFTYPVSLIDGINTITILATDAAGNSTSLTRKVIRDILPPVITISSPVPDMVTKLSSVNLSGTIVDSTSVTLTINGNNVPLTNDTFTYSFVLADGVNSINISATDAAGNTSTVTRTVTRDINPPVITITSPGNNPVTNLTSVNIIGSVSDSTSVTLTMNGNPIALSNGSFNIPVSLVYGINTIIFIATDAAGNTSTVTLTLDTAPPVLTITNPANNFITNQTQLLISGSVDKINSIVTVNNDTLIVSPAGSFSKTISLSEGLNNLQIKAKDQAGNITIVNRIVRVDTTPPVLSLTTPIDNFITNVSLLNVIGLVSDSTNVKLTVNQDSVLVSGGNFTKQLNLVEGLNHIIVKAVDQAGNISSLNRTVRLDRVKPVASINYTVLTVTSDSAIVKLDGRVSDSTKVSIVTNGKSLGQITGSTFTQIIALHGTEKNVITIITDQANNIDTVKQIIDWTPIIIPTDPVTIASKVDKTTSTTIGDALKFLYTGTNPIQQELDPQKLTETRVSLIGGVVLGQDKKPLPGVKVSILNHPEFGYTHSRIDGKYDIVLNGGGLIDLDFVRAGYLSVQRHTQIKWLDYTSIDTLIMTKFDSTSTSITSSNNSLQSVVGNQVVDNDGIRKAVLIVPPQTNASMILPDGSSQPLNNMTVRATEYTIGNSGIESMPAPLPPQTAYTYCVELSIDEAVQANAKSITFDKSMPFYVDNFLNFPVGSSVPAGYYDKEKGIWIPSASGKVIKIVSISNNVANVDINGDGVPEDSTALAAISMNTVEKIKLASLYSPGTSLWRILVNHFTAWDINWGFEPPSDAKSPFANSGSGGGGNGGGPNGSNGPNSPNDNRSNNTKCGSTIGIEAQTLGESSDITGTPFSLNYTSDRVDGYKAARTLRIPLSDSNTLPSSLKKIILEVSIAGRKFEYEFQPQSNLATTFYWDGKDSFGRWIKGSQSYKVTIKYEYNASYSQTYSFGYKGDGIPISGDKERAKLWFTSEWDGVFTSYIAPQLNGWSIDINHSYDPIGLLLYRGDGSKITSQDYVSMINGFAGNGQLGSGGLQGQALSAMLKYPEDVVVAQSGNVYLSDYGNNRILKVDSNGIITQYAGYYTVAGYNGDSYGAVGARLNGPIGLAIDKNENVYFCDNSNSRIRKISANNTISTVAGNGGDAYSGDGGPAANAQIGYPHALAIGPEGNIYFSDDTHPVIRKIDPAGNISRFAGTGGYGSSGDNGLAKNATFYIITGLAVDKDGNVYVADPTSSRVRKITADGKIINFAGNGNSGLTGDGGLATSASLRDPSNIAVTSDGTVYISEGQSNPTSNNSIRKVTPDGIISTIAGIGPSGGGYAGDGSTAKSAKFNQPRGIRVAPDGSIYIVDKNNHRVRKISKPLPSFSPSGYNVVSQDGKEVYIFDKTGKHLVTIDALTSNRIYKFNYNGSGLLSSIKDIDSLTTTIERDTLGNATAIVSPYGVRTQLSIDPNGYIKSITNPAGDTKRYEYTTDGLMIKYFDAKNNLHQFTYDVNGCLIKDQDPEGGFTQLSKSLSTNGYEITTTTAEGRIAKYKTEWLPAGSKKSTVTSEDGLITTTLTTADLKTVTTNPDSSTSSVEYKPEPRFGLEAPLVKKATLTIPGGITNSLAQFRTITSMNGQAVTGLLDTVTVNGKNSYSNFNWNLKQLQTTSPQGRISTTYFNNEGRVVQSLVPGINSLNYTYNTSGLLNKIKQGSRETIYNYDSKGRVSSVTDPLLRTESFAYDTVGRVTKQTLPDGREMHYLYDANGNLTSITPPGRPAHTFTFNTIDLATSYTPPVGLDTTITRYQYNLDKQMTKIFRPDGSIVSINYDPSSCGCASAGKPSSILYNRGYLVYKYNPVTAMLSSVITPLSDTLNYFYRGSLLNKVQWKGSALSGVKGSVSFTYNNDLLVTSQSVNGGSTINFSYDNDGLLVNSGAMALTRNAQNGLITGTTLGNVTGAFTYNSYGEINNYTAKYNGSNIYSAAYAQDSLGRISTLTETIKGVATTFDYTYDTYGYLTKVKKNGAVTSEYTYDSNGNRKRAVINSVADTAAYDAQDRMVLYGNNNYVYTRNGELRYKITGSDTTKYTYDSFGNLINVTKPDGTIIEYVVDAQNRRIAKMINGQITKRWIYQDKLTPAAEVDSVGNVVTRFAPGYITKGDSTYALITDHLGSVRLVVNTQSGAIKQRIEYDEYGNVLVNTNPDFQPFGYAGGLYDDATKLVRFGARDYSAKEGRWTTKDPIGFGGGVSNLYEYCVNDPLNSFDPNGLQTWPGRGSVRSPFGNRIDHFTGNVAFHGGIDISNPLGGNVVSYGSGVVIGISTSSNGAHQIFVQNDNGSISGYAHTTPFNGVKIGSRVEEGGIIGSTDLSGRSTGPHVHFTLRPGHGKDKVNPSDYLPRQNNYPKDRIYPDINVDGGRKPKKGGC